MEKINEKEDDGSSVKIEYYDWKKGSSSFFYTLINTLNAEIGNGIIALAYFAKIAGPGLCSILTIVFGLLTGYTTYALSYVASFPGPKTYGGLVELHLGKFLYVLFEICNISFPLSICVLYSVALSKNVVTVIKAYVATENFFTNRVFILGCFIILIALPTSFLPDVSFLHKISVGSLILVCFYTITFAIKVPIYSAKVLVLPEYWEFAHTGVFQALGGLALSYTIHQGVLHLFGSLKNRSLHKFSCLLNASIGITSFLYLIVMNSIFVSFSGLVISNSILNYCQSDVLLSITTILLSLSLATTMPLQVIFLRDTLMALVVRFWKNIPYLRFIVGFFICVLVFILSSLSESIMAALVIGGALSGGPLNLIFPCLLHILVKNKTFKVLNPQVVFNWILIAMGICLTFLGTSMAVIDVIKGNDSIGTMYWCDEVLE